MSSNARYSKLHVFLYRLRAYFKFCYSDAEDFELLKCFRDAHHIMLRTPLFSLCHYHYSPIQGACLLISGWMLHLWPNPTLDYRQNLYLKEYDWTRVVMTLEQMRNMNK